MNHQLIALSVLGLLANGPQPWHLSHSAITTSEQAASNLPQDGTFRSARGSTKHSQAVQGTECVAEPTEVWFTNARLVSCEFLDQVIVGHEIPSVRGFVPQYRSGAFDINGDGAHESLHFVPESWQGTVLSTEDDERPCLVSTDLRIGDSGVVVSQRPVMTTGQFYAAVRHLYPPVGGNTFVYVTLAIGVSPRLWDADGDGDLDLICRVDFGSDRVAWVLLENTGFQRPPRLSADINEDGIVDGVDLATVLTQWTGS